VLRVIFFSLGGRAIRQRGKELDRVLMHVTPVSSGVVGR
jgi:hypothetical protein